MSLLSDRCYVQTVQNGFLVYVKSLTKYGPFRGLSRLTMSDRLLDKVINVAFLVLLLPRNTCRGAAVLTYGHGRRPFCLSRLVGWHQSIFCLLF